MLLKIVRTANHAVLLNFVLGMSLAMAYPVNKVLLSTHNPLLAKSVHGILRDQGYAIEVVEQPLSLLQRTLGNEYATVIIDSESFGLSAEEIVGILRTILPDMPLLVIGGNPCAEGALSVKAPLDLEEFREVFHTINRISKISQI